MHASCRIGTNIFIAACWIVILSTTCGCASSSIWQRGRIEEGETAEFHGRYHDAFWPYANAGYKAMDDQDWAASQQLYLRAYRNTGMTLAPREDSWIKSALFGMGADMFNGRKIEAYAAKLDELTPLPGTGGATNDVLDGAMKFQRSLAAYDWAIATGHLGNFEGAEKAFLYSLYLEKTKESREQSDALLAKRYYELARLYYAWGKQDQAVQSYRDALLVTKETVIEKSDPIGFADVLDDFSRCLEETGQPSEAAQWRARSAEIRKAHPGKIAKFHAQPYPKPRL